MKLDDMRIFVNVVNTGSITAAAENLGLPKSSLSRKLKLLEENLGARLLERTTRRLQPTEIGFGFYERSKQILADVDTLREQVMQNREQPGGNLTVYTPSGFARIQFREPAIKFAQAYPGLSIKYISGAVKPNLLEDCIDVMIHIDDPQDSSFIARKITIATTNYYASPDYLKRKGTPVVPEDLLEHDCIVELTHDRTPRPWLFPDADCMAKVRVKDRYACDSVELCSTLAEQGLGITMIPDFICKESLENGKLVKLFDGKYEVAHNLYAIYSSQSFLPAKIRVFLDFLDSNLPERI